MPDSKIDAQQWIQMVGDQLGVPKTFRDAIFGIESAGGRPDIHDSVKGAMGPGQLMAGTAAKLGVNPRNPAENIEGSLRLQKQLLDKYRSITGGDEAKSWLLAAAAYNAGEGAVQKHGGIPPYAETQNYVANMAKAIRRAGGPEAISQKQQGQGGGLVGELQKIADELNKKTAQMGGRPVKEPEITSRPKVGPSPFGTPPLQSSTASPSSGLTPPSAFMGSALSGMKTANPLTALIPDDTKRSFIEGVIGAVGSTVKSVGDFANYGFRNPILNPVGAIFGQKEDPAATFLSQTGSDISRKAQIESESHISPTEMGRFGQAVTRGAGAALVELPKLLGAAPYLGAATLPVFGAAAGSSEGTGGLLRGAAMGAVYHYGGGITGKYLGKLGNSLIWVGGPAAESHFVNGTPLGEAIGSSLPMGIFAGVGGSERAKIAKADGTFRDARPTDIPRIVAGKLKLAEPIQVVMSRAADAARARVSKIISDQRGSLPLTQGEPEADQGQLSRLPNHIIPDLVTLGAFHYEAGTQQPEEWLGRMVKEIGERPDTIKPEVAQQLGKVYARSKALFDEGTAPTFVSGLKQTVKELAAQGLIGKKGIRPERLLNLLQSRGQAEELKVSGLDKVLQGKKDPFTAEELFDWLDTKGMTMDVLRGSLAAGRGASILNEEGVPGHVLPQAEMRARYVTPGGKSYFEGVVHSNKSLPISMDDVHFGTRPDQISWYRGQLMGETREPRFLIKASGEHGYYNIVDTTSNTEVLNTPQLMPEIQKQLAIIKRSLADTKDQRFTPTQAILEEVQSKRNSKSRLYGVTEDPANAHAQLIDLQRESNSLEKEIKDLEMDLGLARWAPTDQYSRFDPESELLLGTEDILDDEYADSISKEKAKHLDKLRAKLDNIEMTVNNLEHYTDTAPAPWSPHLDTWYEPALKGFLREAAERLEPDADGNVYMTWAGASDQLERYPSARKLLNKIEWTKNEAWTQAQVDSNLNRFLTEGNIPPPNVPTYDVTVYFARPVHDNGPDRGDAAKTFHGWTEAQIRENLGPEVAEKVVKDQYDQIHTPRAGYELPDYMDGRDQVYEPEELESFTRELDAKKLPMGGDWAVKLYGDTAEKIKELYPNKPELLDYAWRESGNKAIVPSWLEKYSKGWGGSIELTPKESINAAYVDPATDKVVYPTPAILKTEAPTLRIPEAMQKALLKEGQLHFGKSLPALPKNASDALYGIRNRIVSTEMADKARDLVEGRLKTSYNALTGERVPQPPNKEGGFFGLGGKKPELDPRVKTDLEDRDRGDTASFGAFFRSPSRWLAGFQDSRIDGVAERIFDAEIREHDLTTEWGRRFTALTDHLKTATFSRIVPSQSGYTIENERSKPRRLFGKKADKEALDQTYSDFISLIEKDFQVHGDSFVIDNPERRSANPLIQRALEEHDALTKDFKDYLIRSYEDRGITIQDSENWGITEKGYFRHLFPGEDNIFLNGEYQGTGKDYLDAIIRANALIDADPQAKVEIRRRPIQFVDPSLRVTTRSFERLVGKLVGTINEGGDQIISGGELRHDLMGTVGKKENISKFFGAALKREGYEGFLRDYEQVMRAHYFQLARSQELSKLRKDITPTMEELKREGKKGVVEGLERHLDDLWGRPVGYEKAFGGFIRKFPRLAQRIANPDLAMEMTARRIASIHNLLKLRYNPKAVLVNSVQPLRTLWPYLETKDVFETVKKFRDPKWRQDMTELGVMQGAIKLETGGSRVEGFGGKEFLKDPFTYVSGRNRALGYTAGVIFAEREGLSGFDAHKMGMRWAAKVEFDNSKWDAPRFLRHSLGQIFGQYKGFLIKDLENTGNIFSKQIGDRPPLASPFGFELSTSKASRVAKWAFGTGVAGGLRAATSPLAWMGTAAGFSLYLRGAAVIKAMTGVSDKDAKFYSSILFLGPPAALGVDISASVTPIDEPPGLTAWEKLGRFVGGPTVTGVYDTAKGVRQIVAPGAREVRPLGERVANLGTKLSPYVRMIQRGYELEQDVVRGKRQFITIDQHRVPLTRTQELFGMFGVPPAGQTLYYEEKDATGHSPFATGSSNLFGNPNRGFVSEPFGTLPAKPR